MRERFKEIQLRAGTLQVVALCNAIVEEYVAQGFVLTLRQLYYQLVARAYIPNTEQSYKKLGTIVNDARLGGYMDWDAIEDRTRNLVALPQWDSPGDIVETAAKQYHMDMWKGQSDRPEVWVEKEALAGVVAGVCREYDVDYFACRGYVSQSEMFRAGARIYRYRNGGQHVTVLHLGDHDPSGIDMTRDIDERLCMFSYGYVEVKRLALNMDQIEEFGPPPNPAKVTDSRFESYSAEYGDESWELDALEPSVIAGLIESAVTDMIDRDAWEEREAEIEAGKAKLHMVAKKLK